jgi:thiol-disulfide isomerase/thioredoxin
MRAFIVSCISALLCAACAREPQPDLIDAPSIALPEIGRATTLRLTEYCGRVVHVELWGSWCGPCVASMAAADRQRATLRRRDFDVVGVSLDETRASAEAFLAAHPVGFRNAWDGARLTQRAFVVDGVPTAILVDRNGRIRERFDGYTQAHDARLRDALQRLIREPADGSCGRTPQIRSSNGPSTHQSTAIDATTSSSTTMPSAPSSRQPRKDRSWSLAGSVPIP